MTLWALLLWYFRNLIKKTQVDVTQMTDKYVNVSRMVIGTKYEDSRNLDLHSYHVKP
jgi:hypothetical protein